MLAYFDVLHEGSGAHTVEPNLYGFVIRPIKGRQTEFDRIATLTIEQAGDDFAVFPMTNTACGWASLALMPLKRSSV